MKIRIWVYKLKLGTATAISRAIGSSGSELHWARLSVLHAQRVMHSSGEKMASKETEALEGYLQCYPVSCCRKCWPY